MPIVPPALRQGRHLRIISRPALDHLGQALLGSPCEKCRQRHALAITFRRLTAASEAGCRQPLPPARRPAADRHGNRNRLAIFRVLFRWQLSRRARPVLRPVAVAPPGTRGINAADRGQSCLKRLQVRLLQRRCGTGINACRSSEIAVGWVPCRRYQRRAHRPEPGCQDLGMGRCCRRTGSGRHGDST